MKRVLFFLLALASATACKHAAETKRVVITGVDPSIKPGDNFFEYVNSTWYDTARIPASQTGVGSYSFLNFPQRIRLQGILIAFRKAITLLEALKKK
jgi:putative endopeptidase